MRLVWAVACVVFVVAACGGGGLTLSEYAAQSEALVAAVISGLEDLDAEWEAQDPTPEGARAYWDRRVRIRTEFLEGIRALDPPDEVVELHEAALGLFARLTAAEEAVAARVDTFEIIGHGPWWDTPEGQAARAVDAEAIAICHAAQAQLDATQEREILANTPWLTRDMKEVVRVAFGCPP